jgi:cytoskeletal protein CcmA (bactofilin family)
VFEKNRNPNKWGKPEEEAAAEAKEQAAAATAPRPAPAPVIGALLGPSIRIKGEISGEESLVVEGQVEGTVDLSAHDLTIGQAGRVRANVAANVINIKGELYGDMAAREKVVISKTGRVQGNIVAPRVTLEDGAKFKGSIDMDPTEQRILVKPKATSPGPVPAPDQIRTQPSNKTV